MRVFLFLFISTFCFSFNSIAQKSVNLKIEWNFESKRYEVFAVSEETQKNLVLGKSQISIVMPYAAPDSKLNVVSYAGGDWVDENIVLSPKVSTNQDYHAITTKGAVVNLVANQSLLLFSFTFSNNQCQEGLRIFNNDADPQFLSNGSNTIDFNIYLSESSKATQLYKTNLSNTGTKCSDCPVEFTVPKLKKLQD